MVVPLGDAPCCLTADPGFEPFVYKNLQDGTADAWQNAYVFNLQPRRHAEFQETVAPEESFIQLSAYDHHTCALRADSTLACWGCWGGSGEECTPPDGFPNP